MGFRRAALVFFARFSLRAKLYISIFFLLFVTVFIGAIANRAISTLSQSIQSLSGASGAFDYLSQAESTRHSLFATLWYSINSYGVNQPPSESELDEVMASLDSLEENLQKYSIETPLSDQEKVQFKKLESLVSAFRGNLSRLVTELKEAKIERDIIIKSGDALSDEALSLSDLISELSGFLKQKSSVAAAAATEIDRLAALGELIAAILLVLSSLALLIFVHRFSSWLTDFASHLSGGADQVGFAAHGIVSGTDRILASTTQNSASLQEIAASIDQVSAMVSKNATNAISSKGMASKSQASAERGKKAVEDVLHSISDISTSNKEFVSAIESSNSEVSGIVNVIDEIGNKTKVINEIVFQTKLLSFNASVEAARAGEHGKGFSVVAEEVGKLAQMSGDAAKEITDLLVSSVAKVEEIVRNSQKKVAILIADGKSKVESGKITAEKCDIVLDEIVTNGFQIQQLIEEIATACQEQAQGVREITKSINQLDQASQDTSLTAHEFSGAAAKLTEQADQLTSMVTTLSERIHGSKTSHDKSEIKDPPDSDETPSTHRRSNDEPIPGP